MKKQALIIFVGFMILNCNSLIGQNDSLNDQIKAKQDSLRDAEKEVKERQINIDLLNAKRELQALTIKEKEASVKKTKDSYLCGVFSFYYSNCNIHWHN